MGKSQKFHKKPVVIEAWADAASRLPKAEAAPDKDEPTCCHGRTAPCSLCSERNVNPCPTLGRTPGALCVFPLGHECPCAIQIYPRFHAPEQATPGGVSAPPVEEGEVTAQTFEEWWAAYRPPLSDAQIGWKAVAQGAWNAAKASSPVVAGGESEQEQK